MTAPRRRTLALWAATAGVTLVACAAIALAYFAWKGSQFPTLPIRMAGDWLMTRDDEMGFVPTPNGTTEIRNVESGYRFHVYTDRRSARVNAPGDQTPTPVDVVALGCSFTWGAGVESDRTWPQQLGRTMGVSVANLAMGSFGSVQSFLMLMRNEDLRPKVVVYGFIADHMRRNLSPCAPNYVPYCAPVAYLQREGDQIVLKPPHMDLFSPEDNRDFSADVAMHDRPGVGAFLLRTKWAAKIAFFEAQSRIVPYDRTPETAEIALRVMVRAMADEARKIGARFVVLHMPYLVRGQVGPPPPALTDALQGVDATLVDFAPVAAAYYDANPTGNLVLDDDPHPNPLAHRMIAETVAAAVRPLLASASPDRRTP